MPEELMPAAFHLLFGAQARRDETAAQNAAVTRNAYDPTKADSLSLTRWQETAGRQWTSVEVCHSIYGWYVRYASGLDGRAILAATRERGGRLDGSFTDAAKYAAAWVEMDKAHRYAYVRAYDLTWDDTAAGIVLLLTQVEDR